MSDVYFEDDDGYTIPCPMCGEEIYDDVSMCPKCGEYLLNQERRFWGNKPKWLFQLAVLFAVLAAIGFAMPWLSTLMVLLGG